MDTGADPYAVLGVPASSTASTVRAAYLEAVRRWHPDRDPSPEAAVRFLAAQQAWESLEGDLQPEREGADGPTEEDVPAWLRALAEGAASVFVTARSVVRRGLGFHDR
ncbi:MAG: J domain-containing protein [Sporichthyaceae bacterium]